MAGLTQSYINLMYRFFKKQKNNSTLLRAAAKYFGNKHGEQFSYGFYVYNRYLPLPRSTSISKMTTEHDHRMTTEVKISAVDAIII